MGGVQLFTLFCRGSLERRGMKTAVLLCFVFWVTATSSTVTAVRDAQPCTPILNKPGCICKSKYGLIDLTPLGFQNDSAPM